jgi:hypothetical protein
MRDTIDMAREAGMESNEYMLYDSLAHTAWVCSIEDLKTFEALARADEREACAKTCEAMNKYMDDGEECAAAIRARGNT